LLLWSLAFAAIIDEASMSMQEVVTLAFQTLLRDAERVLHEGGWDGRRWQRFPASNDYTRFRVEALNLVRRACGEESDHYCELKRLAETKESSNNSSYFAHCLGIVEAAQRDFERGLLFDMKRLISAEVLGDFIDQAQQLLEAGYHVPAASLCGAVLEDTLRNSARSIRFSHRYRPRSTA
jgi:hypothetical protein